MRVDHFAYQRATRVAGVGFLVQLVIGLTLLIFSLVGGETAPQDTAFLFGSVWILLGLLAWLGLIVLFNQHKLERLEALEEDEIAATRPDAESVFESAEDEIRVAARRLRLMNQWFMPILSVLLAGSLAFSAWVMLRYLGAVRDTEAEFLRTDHVGWAVAICLAFSAVSFIVSRFVAGMAKQPSWQNLRGGAAYMVGNSLVTLAIAVGIGFRFFKNDDVIEYIAYAIPIFMLVVAAEIVLNFVLNLYRPRIGDETPRPAFDSKLLSLFSAPDNLVRSINEAVNYQFGFDITSSWGYQLLLRSFVWLFVLGGLVLVALNTLVIIEPSQQAVRLKWGAMVGDSAHGSGVMWKLPWPLETAEVYNVTSIREMHLTGRQVTSTGADAVQLWTDDLGRKLDTRLVPQLVGARTIDLDEFGVDMLDGALPDGEEGRLTGNFSLLDAEMVLQYRIREDGGLLEYLQFSDAVGSRRQRLAQRQLALKSIALREIGQELSTLPLDGILSTDRGGLAERLRQRVQGAFDQHRTGVDVVAVNLPILRPAGEAAAGFEELSVSDQAREQFIANAREQVVAGIAQLIGDPDRVDEVVAEVDAFEALRREHGTEHPDTIAKRVQIEQLLAQTGGSVNQEIVEAERDRWVTLMEARIQASRLRGQLVSYEAAPNLYRVRETMLVYGNALSSLYKYVIAVDPGRVDFNVELRELNPLFDFTGALDETELESVK